MRILAIDTALPAVSACVLDTSARAPLASESHAMARGHAEALMPLIQRVVAAAPGGFAALDRVAATIGPGSFTGIRVGLAAARAIGLARGVPVVGVTTLAALAAPLILAHDQRPILACVDARHGHCYAQLFSGTGQVLGPPVCARNAEIAEMGGADERRLVGDGAALVAVDVWARGVKAEIVGDAAAPGIAFVAMLGSLADPDASPARPLYLKAVDATPMRARAAPASV